MMTDKQIIIDGVDVSGCSCYVSTGECVNENVYPDYCKVCSNCTYKLEQQLKRKEQECEELNKKIVNQAKIIYELKNEFKKTKIFNNEIKKSKNELFDTWKRQLDKLNKYEQTLTEIKEVLQLYNNTTIGIDKGNGIFEFEVSNDNVLGGKLICCYDTNPAKKALQKISEVEDETTK